MRPRGTDGTLLASLPWTLAALAVSLSPHLPYLPIWISFAFAGCAIWRYVIEQQRRLLPPAWLRAALALVCFLGVFATYSSISGVGPGSALLAIMAALKLLETRKRRDQFVLLFISIFLVMSSLLREQYLWSLPYMVIGMLVIVTAWLRMSAGDSETTKQSFATGGRLMMYAAPLAIAMWVLFPRLASPFWSVPIDASRAATGISDKMTPGDISSLSLSNAVAFRVTFEGDLPEPRDRYWRGLVMTRFDGRTWTGSEPREGKLPSEQIEVRGLPVEYQITMEPTQQQWVFALDMPYSWKNFDNAFMGPQQQLFHLTPIEQRVAYDVISYSDYRVQAALPASSRDWNTHIPDGSNGRSHKLARDMRRAADSEAAYVDAVLRMFNQEEFFYTLEPPPLGDNPVDRFLFNTRRGFCEHFASAFAFMMRSAGIPARVVVGYQGGEVNPLGGHLIVRQSDAHAWTEVWLGEFGWLRVDPTAAVAPERIEYGTRDPANSDIAAMWGFSAPSKLLHNLTLTLDAMSAKWNDWILGYGPDTQSTFLEWMGMDDPGWRKMLLTLLAVVMTMIAMISGLLVMRYRRPTIDVASKLYASFVNRSGLKLQTGETALDFSDRLCTETTLHADRVTAVTTAYLDARYGPCDERSLSRLKSAVAAID